MGRFGSQTSIFRSVRRLDAAQLGAGNLALYFASQSAGRLFWPLAASIVCMLIVVFGGWVALAATDSLAWVFIPVATGMAVYGVGMGFVTGRGGWFRGKCFLPLASTALPEGYHFDGVEAA